MATPLSRPNRRSSVSRSLPLRLTVVLLIAALSGCGFTSEPAASTPAASSAVEPGIAAPDALTPASTVADPARPLPPPLTLQPGVPVLSRLPITENVVFLTIDDAALRNPGWIEHIRASRVPVTVFPISTMTTADPAFFTGLQTTGAVIENHTVTHPSLTTLSTAAQQHEICGGADHVASVTGRRPALFRPPFGNYNPGTVAAAQACGMRAILLWRVAVNDGVVQFQTGSTLQPGDVVLMHFRTTFIEDFDAAVAKAKADGFRFGLLEDYLVPETLPPGLPRPSGIPA